MATRLHKEHITFSTTNFLVRTNWCGQKTLDVLTFQLHSVKYPNKTNTTSLWKCVQETELECICMHIFYQNQTIKWIKRQQNLLHFFPHGGTSWHIMPMNAQSMPHTIRIILKSSCFGNILSLEVSTAMHATTTDMPQYVMSVCRIMVDHCNMHNSK
jgi:hypothetical protein